MRKTVILLLAAVSVLFMTSASFADYVTVYKSSFRETCVLQESIEIKEVGRYYQATVLTYPKHGDPRRSYNGNLVREIAQVMAFDPVTPKYKFLEVYYDTTIGTKNIVNKGFHTRSYQSAANDRELYAIWKYVTEYAKSMRR